MTVFHLMRHGDNDMISRRVLAGRAGGISLNETGRLQAEAVATFFEGHTIDVIVSSPLERCRETAEPLARRQSREILVDPGVLEVDYGHWTKMAVEELQKIEEWKHWNQFRSGTRVPGGETILEVQQRTVGALEQLRNHHAGKVIAVFSHGDPIRAVLAYYLGMPLDLLFRLEVAPGSINTLAIGDWGAQVRLLNFQPSLVTRPSSSRS